LSSEGEGFADHLGLLPSPRVQTENDKRKKGLQDLWTSKRNLQQILSLHLVGLQGRKGNKERKTWVRVLMAELNFEFESFRKEFENPPTWVSKVSR
jgi:hypothetical protein